jgi:hypothetical protein
MTAIINPALPASPPTSGISRYARQIGQGVRVLVPVTGARSGRRARTAPAAAVSSAGSSAPAGRAPATAHARRFRQRVRQRSNAAETQARLEPEYYSGTSARTHFTTKGHFGNLDWKSGARYKSMSAVPSANLNLESQSANAPGAPGRGSLGQWFGESEWTTAEPDSEIKPVRVSGGTSRSCF